MLEIWVIYLGALLGHLVPWTSGCFLSSSMSVCGVIAKHFPTLPLARFPFQHRGKYHVHTFHGYSLNDWMFMLGICRGIGTVSFTLRACCWLQYFLFGRVSFPALPFCWRYSPLGFMVFTWDASAFSKSFVCISSSWTHWCWVVCWLLFCPLSNFQTTSKGTHGYLPGCYSLPLLFLWQYSSLGAVSTRMLQSEGMTVKKLHSDVHDLACLSKLCPLSLLCHLRRSLQAIACIPEVTHHLSFL